MLKQTFIVVALVTILVSCKSKSAFNYSESIVEKERSLTADIKTTETKVMDFLKEEKFDSIAAAGEAMEKKVQVKIDEIDAMPLPDAKGASDFKSASLDYFRYIKSLYTSYKKIGQAQTQEERTKLFEDLQDIVADKSLVLNKMQGAQQKYASDNGFKVQ